jgi:hypothetical protein
MAAVSVPNDAGGRHPRWAIPTVETSERWFLPRDTPIRTSWVLAALEHWHARWPKRFPRVRDWRHEIDWLTPDEATFVRHWRTWQRELTGVLHEIGQREKATRAELERLGSQADQFERRLLASKGAELVQVVARASRELGFEVYESDETAEPGRNLEDLQVRAPEDPQWVGIVEVRKYRGGGTPSHLMRISRFTIEFTARYKRAPDAEWYVLNQFIGRDPGERPTPLASERAAVVEWGGVVLDTAELFRLLMVVRRQEMTAREARERLLIAPQPRFGSTIPRGRSTTSEGRSPAVSAASAWPLSPRPRRDYDLGLSEFDLHPDVDALAEAVTEMHTLYQATRYSHAGGMAPLLIRQGERAVALADAGDAQWRAAAALATTYHAVTALLVRVGETELAWVAGDRAINAARRADDPALEAVGLYRLGHVMLRAGRPDEAHRMATRAAQSLGDANIPTPAAIAVRGALLLISAVSASRHDDRRESGLLLRQAGDLAEQLGADRNDHWTAFGPTNVRIHATSVAVELGDPPDALRQGELVDVHRLASGLRGRRSQVHIDLAWAYGQQRNDPATVLSLLEAERVAPEVLRYNVTARELIRECLRRECRAAVPGLRGLAERTGIAA